MHKRRQLAFNPNSDIVHIWFWSQYENSMDNLLVCWQKRQDDDGDGNTIVTMVFKNYSFYYDKFVLFDAIYLV